MKLKPGEGQKQTNPGQMRHPVNEKAGTKKARENQNRNYSPGTKRARESPPARNIQVIDYSQMNTLPIVEEMAQDDPYGPPGKAATQQTLPTDSGSGIMNWLSVPDEENKKANVQEEEKLFPVPNMKNHFTMRIPAEKFNHTQDTFVVGNETYDVVGFHYEQTHTQSTSPEGQLIYTAKRMIVLFLSKQRSQGTQKDRLLKLKGKEGTFIVRQHTLHWDRPTWIFLSDQLARTGKRGYGPDDITLYMVRDKEEGDQEREWEAVPNTTSASELAVYAQNEEMARQAEHVTYMHYEIYKPKKNPQMTIMDEISQMIGEKKKVQEEQNGESIPPNQSGLDRLGKFAKMIHPNFVENFANGVRFTVIKSPQEIPVHSNTWSAFEAGKCRCGTGFCDWERNCEGCKRFLHPTYAISPDPHETDIILGRASKYECAACTPKEGTDGNPDTTNNMMKTEGPENTDTVYCSVGYCGNPGNIVNPPKTACEDCLKELAEEFGKKLFGPQSGTGVGPDGPPPPPEPKAENEWVEVEMGASEPMDAGTGASDQEGECSADTLIETNALLSNELNSAHIQIANMNSSIGALQAQVANLAAQTGGPAFCCFYSRKGHCRFGQGCRYLHDRAARIANIIQHHPGVPCVCDRVMSRGYCRHQGPHHP